MKYKSIGNVEVARSKRWPNYGVSKCGRAFRWDTEKELKVGWLTGGDYPTFRVSHGGNAGWATIHFAVVECWVENPNPELYVEVNHKDGDKGNYSLDNLEWSTKSQNQQHALRTGLKQKGEELYNAGVRDELVHVICQELQEGCRPRDLADRHGLTFDAVRKIYDGSTYFHIRRLYPIDYNYRKSLSESSVRWVCDKIVEGHGDVPISKMSTNKNITPVEVKRIRYKIRYKSISDDFF